MTSTPKPWYAEDHEGVGHSEVFLLLPGNLRRKFPSLKGKIILPIGEDGRRRHPQKGTWIRFELRDAERFTEKERALLVDLYRGGIVLLEPEDRVEAIGRLVPEKAAPALAPPGMRWNPLLAVFVPEAALSEEGAVKAAALVEQMRAEKEAEKDADFKARLTVAEFAEIARKELAALGLADGKAGETLRRLDDRMRAQLNPDAKEARRAFVAAVALYFGAPESERIEAADSVTGILTWGPPDLQPCADKLCCQPDEPEYLDPRNPDHARKVLDVLREIERGEEDEKAGGKQVHGVTLLQAGRILYDDDLEFAKEAKKKWHNKRAHRLPRPIGISQRDNRDLLYNPSSLCDFLEKIGDVIPENKSLMLKRMQRSRIPGRPMS